MSILEFILRLLLVKTFDDLTPCYSTGVIGGIYGSVNDNESANNPHSFSILAK